MALPSKHPSNIEPYYFVWCSGDGTNDGGANDKGELQGATISSHTVTVGTGLTLDSSNTNSVTIDNVTYDANTVVTYWISGGSADTDYTITCKVVTSDSRTLYGINTIQVRVKEED